jgi:hypothetical protein
MTSLPPPPLTTSSPAPQLIDVVAGRAVEHVVARRAVDGVAAGAAAATTRRGSGDARDPTDLVHLLEADPESVARACRDLPRAASEGAERGEAPAYGEPSHGERVGGEQRRPVGAIGAERDPKGISAPVRRLDDATLYPPDLLGDVARVRVSGIGPGPGGHALDHAAHVGRGDRAAGRHADDAAGRAGIATQTRSFAESMSLPSRSATGIGVGVTGFVPGLSLKTVFVPVVQRFPSEPRVMASAPMPAMLSRSPVFSGSEGEKLPMPLTSVVHSLPFAEVIPVMFPMALGLNVVTCPAGVTRETSCPP